MNEDIRNLLKDLPCHYSTPHTPQSGSCLLNRGDVERVIQELIEEYEG